MSGLQRFVDAQDEGGEFETALGELRSGGKTGHWIWFVFPQLAGLGASAMSRMYAIRDREEAVAYLRHPILFSRLRTITAAAADQVARGVRVETLMGSPVDAQKLVSSLTLFTRVARAISAAADGEAGAFITAGESVLAAAEAEGYPPCRHTVSYLELRGAGQPPAG